METWAGLADSSRTRESWLSKRGPFRGTETWVASSAPRGRLSPVSLETTEGSPDTILQCSRVHCPQPPRRGKEGKGAYHSIQNLTLTSIRLQLQYHFGQRQEALHCYPPISHTPTRHPCKGEGSIAPSPAAVGQTLSSRMAPMWVGGLASGMLQLDVKEGDNRRSGLAGGEGKQRVVGFPTR